jgi:hypothetical protein
VDLRNGDADRAKKRLQAELDDLLSLAYDVGVALSLQQNLDRSEPMTGADHVVDLEPAVRHPARRQ